ncbi:MAG: CvpA family protein, partial [Patescibacteria group bacterium]
FNFIEKAFHLISIIPFLSTANRLAGGILGFIEGVIVLSLLIYFITNYAGIIPFIGDRVDFYLSASRIAPYLSIVSGLMAPFIPELISKFREVL